MSPHVVLVTRPDLADTNGLFRAAAGARDWPLVELTAGAAGGNALPGARRLIYCAATDGPSRLVEKLIARPGDALLHDPHFPCDHAPIRLRMAGVPVARAVYAPAQDRAGLAAQAAWLGGFPVVVKRPGHEGGRGVSRAVDPGDLHRQLRVARFDAWVEAFQPHDLCWRLIVLGEAVLATSASAPARDDFRSNAPGSRTVPDAVLPPGAEAIAVAATRALRLGFAGVDLMQGPDGALTVAEVNFPCFFAQVQADSGVDIAGAILDRLAASPG